MIAQKRNFIKAKHIWERQVGFEDILIEYL